MIDAVGDNVIVEVLKDENKTEGGILVPETTQQPQARGKVLSVGELITTIKSGNIIMCHRAGGQDVLYKGKLYKVLKYGEVYGIVRE